MAEMPLCPNFTKQKGCSKSAIQLKGEGDDHWYFFCDTCKLEWVVSKPSAASRGQFHAAEQRLRVAAEKRRAHGKRTVYST